MAMRKTIKRIVLIGAMLVAGVAGAKSDQAKQAQLEKDAGAAKAAMLQKDPALQSLLDQSAGYIIFPNVKEGGFIVGGAGASGVVYKGGQAVGQAKLSRVSVGATVGGQKYSELIAFRDQATLDKTKSGDMDLGAQASAVVLKTGAATETNFGDKGVAIVVNPKGGAMVSAAVKGQKIRTTM
jgi:lipid-binding SYLF domain-containing protein